MPRERKTGAEMARDGFQRIFRRETERSLVVRKGKTPVLKDSENGSVIPRTGNVKKEIMYSIGI